MSQPPAHGNDAVQNAIPVKAEDTSPPRDHILQGSLQTRHQPTTPAALGFNANRRDTEDNIRIACATAAAVNGAGALVFLAFGAGRDQRYDEPRGGGGGLGAAAVAPLGAKLLADDDGAASGSS